MDGHDYTLVAHALVEIASPRGIFDRHEYLLIDEKGTQALLVQSPTGDPGEWQLLVPAAMPHEFSPYSAAGVHLGLLKLADGTQAEVKSLFRSTVSAREGADSFQGWPETLQYGFLAKTPGGWLLDRWSEKELKAYAGRSVSGREIAAAFHLAGGETK